MGLFKKVFLCMLSLMLVNMSVCYIPLNAQSNDQYFVSLDEEGNVTREKIIFTEDAIQIKHGKLQ